MYDQHVPMIAQQAKSLEGFLAVCRFTFHTIRQRFNRVSIDNRIVGNSEEGWNHLVENAEHFHRVCTDPEIALSDRFYYMLEIKGLNLPKIGFILQMCGHQTGCIDTHHMQSFKKASEEIKKTFPWSRTSRITDGMLKADKRHGLDSKPSKNQGYLSGYYNKQRGMAPLTWHQWSNREKVCRYIGLCHHTPMNSPKEMWDSWCNNIAEVYPDNFANGEEVSRKHYDLILDFKEEIRHGGFGTGSLWRTPKDGKDLFEGALCAS